MQSIERVIASASRCEIVFCGFTDGHPRSPAPTGIPSAGTSVETASGRLGKFISARVSFSFTWTAQYDQAGLLLSLRPGSASLTDTAASPLTPPKWLKTGVEFYNSLPRISTVSCDAWADWSVSPLTNTEASSGKDTWTTVLVERATGSDGKGVSWWVYELLDSGEKIPLREVCWIYGSGEDWELEVAAYVARPAKDGVDESLVAEFKGFSVEWET
jgi:hypothetical protein